METNEQETFTVALTALLENEQVPIKYLHHLSDMSEDDRQLFQTRWSNVEDERRYAIIRHCADLAEDNFVVDFGPLFVSCLRDSYAPVRQAALDGLWDSSDVSLVSVIIKLMEEDPDTAVRRAAAGALAHYVLLVELGDLPTPFGSLIHSALVDVYEDGETPLVVKQAALEALGPINVPQVTNLIEEAYESGYSELQVSALFAMGGSADSRWLTTIFDEMESPYTEMRAEAARAAGMIGGSETISPLAELVFDENREVAEAAIVALGLIGGGQATSLLEQFAADPELEHLELVIDEAIEESNWLEDEFPLHSFADPDEADDEDLFNFGSEQNGSQT